MNTDHNKNIITGKTGNWEMVIGLEVHAQITSHSKLFSGASTDFGAEPNSQVSFVDAAMPGMLPVLNRQCVEQAIKTGLGLNGKINEYSVFERKNYFYPDLPQGYQISQYLHPLVTKGYVDITLDDGTEKRIGVTRLHMEQDAGKSMHDQHPTKSFVDLNRSGVALMEIVSEPDIRSADEAAAYVRYLRTMMQYLETCDGNMEQGSLRCDINLSVRKPGEDFGTRCEIKNVNSIRHVVDAIHYESRRQVDLIEEGGVVVQETRLWDTGAGVTRSMRSKEEAHDYRYFPDPDLLPLIVDDEWVDRVQNNMPELPVEKKTRFIDEYGLSDYDADVLVTQKPRADYFEQVVGDDDDKGGRNPKTVANWVINELLGQLNKQEQDIDDSPVSANQLGQLIDLIEDNTISGRIAKDVFEDMFATGKDPEKIVEDKGLKQITDTDALDQVVAQVLAENPEQVENYKGGKKKLLGYFVGQCMQKTKGKANPQQVNQLLREKLD